MWWLENDKVFKMHTLGQAAVCLLAMGPMFALVIGMALQHMLSHAHTHTEKRTHRKINEDHVSLLILYKHTHAGIHRKKGSNCLMVTLSDCCFRWEVGTCRLSIHAHTHNHIWHISMSLSAHADDPAIHTHIQQQTAMHLQPIHRPWADGHVSHT